MRLRDWGLEVKVRAWGLKVRAGGFKVRAWGFKGCLLFKGCLSCLAIEFRVKGLGLGAKGEVLRGRGTCHQRLLPRFLGHAPPPGAPLLSISL